MPRDMDKINKDMRNRAVEGVVDLNKEAEQIEQDIGILEVGPTDEGTKRMIKQKRTRLGSINEMMGMFLEIIEFDVE